MSDVITYVGSLTVLTCPTCAMRFGMPDDYERHRRDDHKQFYCPAGHTQYFSGKSEAERLAEQLGSSQRSLEFYRGEAERQRQFKLAAQRSVRARKGVATRLRNRIARGQCPCCSETFKNLKLHMKSKHPKWDIEKSVAALTNQGAV